MLSKVLGFTTTIGVTLAIVRKARDIFWAQLVWLYCFTKDSRFAEWEKKRGKV